MNRFLIFILPVLFTSQSIAVAAHSGSFTKHLPSLLKWGSRPASKASRTDANTIEFEEGYVVETVVEGNEIGVVPHKIRVSEDGDLLSVDEIKSNIVKFTPPLSQYSRARLVAGSFEGYAGYVDGKPSEARFNHPKGITLDDKGNVYIADTLNLAIRKIGEAGVTTIAGGKSNVAGYRDGPSQDAKFSNDFDVIYVPATCSLLVVDRGNAALRKISLGSDDCNRQTDSFVITDMVFVFGAILAGYVIGLLRHWVGSSRFTKMHRPRSSEMGYKVKPPNEMPPRVISDTEEPGWPSFGELILDLSRSALESLITIAMCFMPSWVMFWAPRKGLTPLQDSLILPEDQAHLTHASSQGSTSSMFETSQTATRPLGAEPPHRRPVHTGDTFPPSYRPSKPHDHREAYAYGDTVPQAKMRMEMERIGHRHRGRSGEMMSRSVSGEEKSGAFRTGDVDNPPRFEGYNTGRKYETRYMY